MSAWERWGLHLAALTTAATGMLYGWARYFGARAGEFGPEAHPWQSLFQHAHVLASPALLFALGMVVKGHAQAALRSDRRTGRRSGLGLVLLLAPLALSGYLLQVVTEAATRQALAWVHGPLALLFLLAYVAHLGVSRALALRARAATGMMEGPGTRSSVG